MNDVALRFRARDAQRVLLVQALEESDRGGEVLDLDVRREATREALAAVGEGRRRTSRWLARRARTLVEVLTRDGSPHRSKVRRVLRLSDPLRGWVLLLVMVAFFVGVGSNVLGPERRVNLLAPPLLALILWNLGIFLALAVRRVLALVRPSRGVSPWIHRLEEWTKRFAGGDDGGWVRSFLSRWLPASRRLASARLSRTLHLAALAMVAGVVGGMYLRGLVLAYEATWESTFLGAPQVDALLGFVLAPAGLVLGTGVPSAAALEAPASGSAARWIHLWATTALLFVGVPRLLLALADALAAWRAGRRMEIVLPASYPKRLRASASAQTPEVQVLPFSYRPGDRASQSLRELLQDLAGARAHVRFAPSLDYGSEPPDSFDGTLRVLVFNLAQTPEVEVHGEVLRSLCRELPDGQGLLVLVDESPLRRKLENLAPDVADERLDSRRRAWRRVVEGEELKPVLVDLEADLESTDDAPPREETLDAMGRALWPAARRDALAWSA